jgi:hypothetical protein
MALNAVLLQNTVQPEPVQPRLLDRDDRIALPVRTSALRLSSANSAKSSAVSPAATLCLDIFSPLPGDNDVTSQFERLSSSDIKIAAICVRIAVGPSKG